MSAKAPPKPDGRRRAPLLFDPEARLIDRIRDPDIATFRITIREAALRGIGTVTNWPPWVPERRLTPSSAYQYSDTHLRLFELQGLSFP